MTRRAQTPLMLSWTGYLDEDYESKANFGRTYTVLPKDRHATVLIPVLNSLNLATIDLLNDKAIGVRAAVVNFLSDYMRNAIRLAALRRRRAPLPGRARS